jgi:hypothetical protein
MDPNDNTQENSGFSELSSLIDDSSNEPHLDLTPTQAVSEDGQVVELGGNEEDIVHKDI